ncbi:MarR family winged helix-turn-helix transcriptional regulator [Krasilnikoviella flava]|uniref:DNA-binding transcriptional regulator, MarR family n=1 Tax=Krasilnikoviella flava TaxID=526729 RepID=A0A1T5K9T0_9MICO|nr:MarR family winged helix-turn-helix transcriptional regulator [Krasilnikoviella flava]SKC60436.1 DNA-binding transcriptional regulator, MarR family [Krasilnikoviella flava]
MPSETPSSATSPTRSAPFGTGPGLAPDRRIAALLARLDVHRRLAEHRSVIGVADGRLLWLLSDGRPRTLREIADSLRLEQSTVNRQVNGALAAGLLRRFTEPGRSARLVEPTAEGLALFETATGQALGAYSDGLAVLGDDVETFLELLGRFADAYGDAVREA